MKDIKRYGLSFVESAFERAEESYLLAKELVENLFFEMSKLSTRFCNDIFYDLPYTYSERRIDSVLLPALSKLCNSMVLVEYPVSRSCSNRHFNVEESNGRIDYWCLYKGYSFVIEMKHSFDCFTTSNTRKDKVASRWLKMNEQLESVKSEIKEFEEKTKGVIRIGIHLITSYSDKSPSRQLISQFRNSIPETFERLTRDVSKQYPSLSPDIIICWKVPQKIVLEDGSQTFPGLWIMSKIYPAIKHRGKICTKE